MEVKSRAYSKLMDLGRVVVRSEELFGKGSVQHKLAVAAWRRQQGKMGVK